MPSEMVEEVLLLGVLRKQTIATIGTQASLQATLTAAPLVFPVEGRFATVSRSDTAFGLPGLDIDAACEIVGAILISQCQVYYFKCEQVL